jgi:F0F1-type ATP synthase membrane subunit b/b'
MNLHVAMTPTQARLYEERKAREARIAAAARRAKEMKQEAKSEAAWSDLRKYVISIKAKAEREAQEAKERAEKAEREIAKRKAQWRASWNYMIQLATDKARRQAAHLSYIQRQKLFADVPEPEITGAEILEQTVKKYAAHGVTINSMKSPRRTRGALIQARFEFYWRCREETGLSLPQIGRMVGGKDHTTVLHGVRMYQKFREQMRGGPQVYPDAARFCGIVIPELVITE